MKTRIKPLTIPDTRIYIEIDVPGKGPHHFRLPRMAQALELLELIPKEEQEETLRILKEGSIRDTMAHYANVEERAARIVGQLWWHKDLELESDREDGQALADEFHEAGYAPTELYSLCTSLMGPLAQVLFPTTEAKKGDFFDETHGDAETPQ